MALDTSQYSIITYMVEESKKSAYMCNRFTLLYNWKYLNKNLKLLTIKKKKKEVQGSCMDPVRLFNLKKQHDLNQMIQA